MKKSLSLLLSFSCFAIFNLYGADNNNGGMVRFFVKTMDGQCIEKIKSKVSTVKSLLKDLSKNHGRSKGILLFTGKRLEQENTLDDYNIGTETNVFFVSRNSVQSYSSHDDFSDDEQSDWND